MWHKQADVKWGTTRSYTWKHPKKRDHQMEDLCTNRGNITADLQYVRCGLEFCSVG